MTEIPESIRHSASSNWSVSDLDSAEDIEAFVDSVVREGLRCNLEGDCLTMSEAVVVAFDALGVHATVVDGQFREGPGPAGLVPHNWVQFHGHQLPVENGGVWIADPTAEQFMSEDFPHSTLVTPLNSEPAERYHGG